MSMILEQVIADCEEEISDCQIDLDGIAKLLEEYAERKEAFAYDIDDYKKRMDYNRQLAKWLKELQERRKQPEIIYCKDCGNWDTTWQNDSAPNYHYCPMMDGTYSGDFYCAKSERRTDG